MSGASSSGSRSIGGDKPPTTEHPSDNIRVTTSDGYMDRLELLPDDSTSPLSPGDHREEHPTTPKRKRRRQSTAATSPLVSRRQRRNKQLSGVPLVSLRSTNPRPEWSSAYWWDHEQLVEYGDEMKGHIPKYVGSHGKLIDSMNRLLTAGLTDENNVKLESSQVKHEQRIGTTDMIDMQRGASTALSSDRGYDQTSGSRLQHYKSTVRILPRDQIIADDIRFLEKAPFLFSLNVTNCGSLETAMNMNYFNNTVAIASDEHPLGSSRNFTMSVFSDLPAATFTRKLVGTLLPKCSQYRLLDPGITEELRRHHRLRMICERERQALDAIERGWQEQEGVWISRVMAETLPNPELL